ncbi:MAG: pseudouridine synthase [Alphaproteobacteria bacterium]
MIRDLVYNPPTDPWLQLLYEDADVLVFSKPTGLLTVPGKAPELGDCLETRVKDAYPEALLVHRLDMETSGVCIFARSKLAQKGLGRQFEKRKIEKTYIAWVWGEVTADAGHVDQPLICDWPNRPLQKICHETGKKSQTDWRVLERKENATKVELRPKTGRSHQLRVHMQHLGHPILGDSLYAHDEAFHATPRLMLQAQKLVFIQPTEGYWVTVEDEVTL